MISINTFNTVQTVLFTYERHSRGGIAVIAIDFEGHVRTLLGIPCLLGLTYWTEIVQSQDSEAELLAFAQDLLLYEICIRSLYLELMCML